LPLDVLSNFATSFRLFHKPSDTLREVIPPDDHDRYCHNSQIAHEHQDKEHGLLEASQVAQIDRVEPDIAYCACAEEDSIDVCQLEICGAAAIENARADDDDKDEVQQMNTVEVEMEE